MTPFNPQQPFVLIGALLEREGKFLMLKENHDPDKGLWNIPSGKIDLGESPVNCVKREVKEEAGLEFEPLNIAVISSVVRRHTQSPNATHIFRVIFTGKFSGQIDFAGNEIDSAGDREIAESRWLTLDEINSGQFPQRHPDVPEAIKRYNSGQLLPLDTLPHIEWVREPSASR